MCKFGELEDCIVMKDRTTGRSRGFGYVTFATDEDTKNALSSEHFLGERMLEVKVATPKEEMRQTPRKVTRIFVARIPLSVTEATFRSHFQKYGEIVLFESYICKGILSQFVLFESLLYSIIRPSSLHQPKYGCVHMTYLMQYHGTRNHHGIGFITFASADSVDSLMDEKHELGGSTVVVDHATPKEDDFRPIGRMSEPTAYDPRGRQSCASHV